MFIKYVSVMSEKMYAVFRWCQLYTICVCVHVLHVDGTGAEEGGGEDEQRGT